MQKYEWYFINKGDDVCKHVNYKLLIYNFQRISAHSRYLTLFTVLNIFLKLMLSSYLTYEILYS